MRKIDFPHLFNVPVKIVKCYERNVIKKKCVQCNLQFIYNGPR